MSDETHVGLGQYSAGARSAPQRMFTKLAEKARLRAAMLAVQADIDAMLPTLSPAELAEVQNMMEVEVAAAAADVAADAATLRQQIEREAALAQSTRAMEVRLSREASRTLQAEMMRRLEHDYCPAPAALVGEAVAKAFAGACP